MFNITNVRGKVAKFCIFKTVYRLGEDVIGTFTFSEGDIPCLQVYYTLRFKSFGTVSVFCSPRLHLFNQKYKKSKILKFYNLK